MESTIEFTPTELVAVCAGILTLVALAEKVVKWVKALKKPNIDQNNKLDEVGRMLDMDKKRLDMHDGELTEIKHSIKTLQRGVFELLGNAIDKGNNVEAMTEARNELKKDIF